MKNLRLKTNVSNVDEPIRTTIKSDCIPNLKTLSVFLLICVMTISFNSKIVAQQSITSNCGSTTSIISSEGNKKFYAGIKGKSNATIDLGQSATGAYIECTCRFRYVADGDCPSSIIVDIQKPDGSVTQKVVNAKAIKPAMETEYPSKVYRLNYNGPVTKVTYKNSSSINSMRGMMVWKKLESIKPNLPNLYFAGQFFFNRFERETDSKTYYIKVPSSPGKNRNFVIEIPIGDHGNNNRIVQYTITAYNGNQVLKSSGAINKSNNNYQSEIRMDRFTLNNVDGRVTQIAVKIQSIPQGNIVGASLIVGSILVSSTPCCTPTLNCAANITLSSDVNTCSYKIKGKELDPTVSGNCGAKLFNSFNGKETLAGTTFPKGKTNITWSTWGGTIKCQTSITVNVVETCPASTCFSKFEFNAATCSCVETPIPTNCDDGIECTKDSINPETCECEHEYIDSEISCNIEDWFALKALYESTNGDNWINNSGWKDQFSADCPPATCDLSNLYRVKLNEDGRVESINLFNNNLIGRLPPEIGDLTALKYLFISSVDFLGNPIPKELGNLMNLERLSMVSSNLGGFIPPELGNLTKLWDLRLDYNVLEGNIPKELINIGSLTNLNVNNNQLSGCYFDELKVFCSQLTSFYFNGNADISANNDFDADWEDFCSNGSGTCNNFKLSNFTEFSMYPNPTSSKVTIELDNEDTAPQSLTIYDIAGEQYLLQSFEAGSNKTVEWDVSDFPKGIYVVELKDGFQLSMQKLVVQ